MVIQGHEQCVDDNAKRDKQLDKRIKHNPCYPFLKLQPAPTTIPDAECFDALEHCYDHFLFEGRTVVVILFFWWEKVDRRWKCKKRTKRRRELLKLEMLFQYPSKEKKRKREKKFFLDFLKVLDLFSFFGFKQRIKLERIWRSELFEVDYQ